MKVLQYETVVPGQDADVVVVQHEDGTEEHHVVPAGSMREGDDAAHLSRNAGANLAITGAGLSDLQTEGNPDDVMALSSNSATQRLEARIAGLERATMSRGQSDYSMHDIMQRLGNQDGNVRPPLDVRRTTQNRTGSSAIVTQVARAPKNQQNMDPFSNSADLMLPEGNRGTSRYNDQAFNNV